MDLLDPKILQMKMDCQTMCASAFAVKGDAIRKVRPDMRTIRKRGLSALVHNYIQSHGVFKKLKKPQKRDDKFECGCCTKLVRQLEIAHAGETVSTMIESILDEHPEESIESLFIKLLDTHELPETVFVVCCAKCNKKLEQEFNRSRADHLAHTEQALIVIPRGTVENFLGVPVNDQ